MIKFILRTNKWYESLPERSGSLFYMALIFIPYIILMITLNKPYYNLSIVWPFLVGIWRFSYKILKDVYGK